MSTLAEISTPKSRRRPSPAFCLWLLLVVILACRRAVRLRLLCRALRPAPARWAPSGQRDLGTGHGDPRQPRRSHDRGRHSGRSVLRAGLCDSAGPVVADGRHAPLWQAANCRRFWARAPVKLDREQRILGLRAAARKTLEMANAARPQFLRSVRTRSECLHCDAWRPAAD